jgi:iron complex outermembrane receptor protein
VRADVDPFTPVVPGALPRIPAARFGVGLRYERRSYWARVEALRVSEQDRVALFETPTDGYTLLGAGAAYRLQSGSVVHDFMLRITNWTDELARVHASTLKAIVPLPGRDVTVGYRVLF